MVLQDTLLFSTSIRENIGYGREGASDAEIVEAAKRAQAYAWEAAFLSLVVQFVFSNVMRVQPSSLAKRSQKD